MRYAKSSSRLLQHISGPVVRGIKSRASGGSTGSALAFGAGLFPRVWEPFGDNSFLGSSVFPADFVAKTDVSETDKDFKISVDLPGMKRNEIKVSVSKDGVLTIEGERRQENSKEEDQDGVKFHRVEKKYGHFSRRFDLPPGTDPATVQVSFKDGVLVVSVPKGATLPTGEHVLEIKE
jgi:HSP20 family protein